MTPDLPFEIPLSVLVLGLITGMTYGLLAVGLILIYQSNRIVNFAHGEIGAFAGAGFGFAVTRWGVPYWVGLPLAILLGASLGGASESVVVRRLRRAPALMSIVATLGLAQFLFILSLAINAQASAGRLFPTPPWLPTFSVQGLRVTSAYSAMLTMSPLIVAALAFFLRRSRYGKAVRAAAANPDAARLAGVSSSRMSSLIWAIAGGLSAFTAILIMPTRGFTGAELLGPGLLLRALLASVLARMGNLRLGFVGGVATGVIEQVLFWNSPRGGLVEAVLFSLILLVLLAQRRHGGRSEDKGSWAVVQPWSPLPEAYLAIFPVRNLGRFLMTGAALGAIALTLVIAHAAALTLATIAAFGLVGLSIGIVTGLGGQLSLGQFAVAGVGATASAVIAQHTGHYPLGLLAAGVAGAGVSLVIGLPALRIRGLMLAVTTLGFALAANGWLLRQPWMLGEGLDPGRPEVAGIRFDTGRKYYLLSLVVLAIGLWLSRNVWRSGLGRAMRAVRDNEDGARAFAVSATRVKLQSFVVAGFIAGLGGAIFGHSLSRLSVTAFPIADSINVAAMAVLGGIGVLIGPLLGALYIIGIPRFLPLDTAGLAATAFGWLILILYFPGGIAQVVGPIRDRTVDWLARRRGLDPTELRAGVEDLGVTMAIGFPDAPATTPRGHNAEPLLETTGLLKRYGGITAVDHVGVRVDRGETLGLIGPNGAGKTTLFELISGFTQPDEGTIRYSNQDVGSLSPEARARMGLIRSFQDASLFPTLTILEAVKLALERSSPTSFISAVAGLMGAERNKDKRAREVVGTMGLSPFQNKQIRELSTGTRRITELACLVTLGPSLLLLDEPSSGIAQRETERLGEVLELLRGQLGLTLVVIEHDMPLIMSLSDRIVAMDSGRVIADGSPEEVRNDPLVVESYLGSDLRAIQRSGAFAPSASSLSDVPPGSARGPGSVR